MGETGFWIAIGAISLGTQAMRLIPMLSHGRISTPPVVERLLRHLPAVALAALAAPGALYARSGTYDFAPARTLAALVALAVALRWRSLPAALVAGMAALYALNAVF